MKKTWLNWLKFWTNWPVRFKFYKPEIEKTESNRIQTGKNRAKPKKPRQTRKNRAKPVWTGFYPKKPNRKWSVWTGFGSVSIFFLIFFYLIIFFYKNQTETKTSNLNSKLIHFQKSCQPRVNPHSQNIT
jgi:ATP-dependent Zn protease